MPSRNTLITVAIFAAFIGFLVWSSLTASQAECTVCVAYRGGQNCATVAATTEDEARRAAHSTACAVLTSGVTQTLACDRETPVSTECSTR